jgi:hypothetical protein
LLGIFVWFFFVTYFYVVFSENLRAGTNGFPRRLN